MAVITTGSHPKALWPGIHAWWGREYNKLPLYAGQMFDVTRSKMAYEEDVEATGFGLAPVKTQGAAVSYDDESQGTVTRYTHVAYSLGYIVTREEQDDNLYTVVSKRRAGALAFSMRTTKETVAANVYNRAFDNTYTGGDGKEMIATDHPTVNGTQSNHIASNSDLSEAAIEDMLIQIRQAKNSRGLRINLMGESLIIPPNLEFEANRILFSTLQAGTANNDVNAMRRMGMLPKGIVCNPFLSDTDAWFIRTNAPSGLMLFERNATDFAQDNDFDTSNLKAKSYMRFSVGWTDFRGIYGSPGA